MRLGFLSLLALAFRTLAGMCGANREIALPTDVFCAANIVTAVLFGLGHLPATAAIAPLSVALVVRAIVLNGTAGLVFGALYRRYGLEWAMTSHLASILSPISPSAEPRHTTWRVQRLADASDLSAKTNLRLRLSQCGVFGRRASNLRVLQLGEFSRGAAQRAAAAQGRPLLDRSTAAYRRDPVPAHASGAVSQKFGPGVHMPTRNDTLKDRLSRYREIKITVTGRNSGRAISMPVWFVLDNENLYLLPVQGSDTQWYKNVRKNPSIRINARGTEAEFNVAPVTDPTQVSSVVEKFRHKYGAGDVKKYYSKFDVAVPRGRADPASPSPRPQRDGPTGATRRIQQSEGRR